VGRFCWSKAGLAGLESNVSWQDQISVDRNVLLGKPVVRGTRIAVDHVTDLLDQGWSAAQVIENYPGLTLEDISACLTFQELAADRWDRQIKSDIARGRLDTAGKRADDDFEAGKCSRL
jgi:uncharacterized protein (DUF433 family)